MCTHFWTSRRMFQNFERLMIYGTFLLLSSCSENRIDSTVRILSRHANDSIMESQELFSSEDGKYIYRKYNENGKLQKVEPYENMLLHGLKEEYYYAGNVKKLETYSFGKKNGMSKAFYGSGELLIEAMYNMDTTMYLKKFYKNGQLISDIPLIKGKLDSTATYYDEKGRVLKKGFFKNNKKHGRWVYYNLDGTTYAEEYYNNGKVQNFKKLNN